MLVTMRWQLSFGFGIVDNPNSDSPEGKEHCFAAQLKAAPGCGMNQGVGCRR